MDRDHEDFSLSSDPSAWSLRATTVAAACDDGDTDGGPRGPKVSRLSNVQLATEVEAALVRAVSLSTTLSGWGKHWVRPSLTSTYETEKGHDLSVEVTRYHHFLSHDWKTGRWSKFLTMLILFNLRPATITTLLAAITVGLCKGTGAVYEDGSVSSMFLVNFTPYLVFLFFMCFWQRLRSCRPLMVFLDKLCIEQRDPIRKAKGIRGLAAFLDRSESMVIMWSSQYLTRLWCSYEVATFLRVHGKAKLVTLFPVSMAWVMILEAMKLATAVILFVFTFGSGGYVLLLTTVWLVVNVLVGPVYCYIALGLMKEVRGLNHQFRCFSIRNSECFCCSCGHQDPETGETLMCDRQLVYDAVKRWYGADEDEEEEHLDRFDEVVRTTLRSQVSEGAESAVLPFRISMYLSLAMSAPFLCGLVTFPLGGDVYARAPPMPDDRGVFYILWRCLAVTSLYWLQDVAVCILSIGLGLRICKWGSHLLNRCSQVTATLVVSPVLIISMISLGLGVSYSFEVLQHQNLWDLMPCLLALWLLVAIGLFKAP
ncbi:Uncharacterized protein SCF082_LOCUS19140 [Durusdinium trenchii]|uniref:Uncharacterized protein n=1 Tax=Durusdinium trenchii TaxID=1381693 RepID=A0ABP0KWB2_9DINO